MANKVERISPCRVGITASVDAERTAAERDRVTSVYARKAAVDGFRRGKAPRSLVERRFAKEIEDDLQEELLHVVWHEAREANSFRPAGPLEVREAQFAPDGAFNVSGELDVYPDVVVQPVSGFVPPAFDLEPAADEVEAQLAELRERQVAWEPVEGEVVADGMLVESEVFGDFPDGGGEAFHEERSLFRVGGGEVHPEIEAAVLGHSVGDEVVTEKVLGEDAGPERAGKRISYRIIVKSLRRKRLPELDDAFASSFGVTGGLPVLREQILQRLRIGKLRQRREAWRGALIGHLKGDAAVELPARLVEEETREEVMRFARTLAESGVDLDKASIDWRRVESDMQSRVEGRMRGELVLDAAADMMALSVEDAEVDAEVERQARAIGVPFAELKGNLAKKDGLDKVRAILRREKVLDTALPPLALGAAAAPDPEGGQRGE